MTLLHQQRPSRRAGSAPLLLALALTGICAGLCLYVALDGRSETGSSNPALGPDVESAPARRLGALTERRRAEPSSLRRSQPGIESFPQAEPAAVAPEDRGGTNDVPRRASVRFEDPERQQRLEELCQLAGQDPGRAAGPLADYVLSATGETREVINCLRAVARLGELPQDASGAELGRIYGACEGEVRLLAARMLERQGDARAMGIEIQRMEEDFLCAQGASRSRLARKTSRLASASALPLLRTMMSDASPAIRLEAATGLGRVEDPAARSELELACLDGDADVRSCAEELLQARDTSERQ